MRGATFNRTVTVIFAVLGVIDVVAGAGFILGADRFGLDRRFAWYAGALFVAMGAGMLLFLWRKGTWSARNRR